MISIFIFIAFLIALWQLLTKINKGFPIFQLTIVLYVLQYLVAPFFDYNYNFYWRELMAVPANVYFNFTFIAVLAFAFGLFCVTSKLRFEITNIEQNKASLLGRVLIIIGVSAKIMTLYLPDTVEAFFYFFKLFIGIGIYALVFSDKKIDKLFILFFSLFLGIYSVISTEILNFIVFALFLSMFLSLKYKFSIKLKLVLIIIGFIFLNLYQSFKIEYREVAWNDEVSFSEKVNSLSSFINKETIATTFNFDFKNNRPFIYTMHRLNQGWQTSMVYRHVPHQVNYEYGQDFINDVLSSFVPRIFWKNKKKVNDKDRFRYYTGWHINNTTTMNIGVIGDFYINFGKVGTVIAMLIFGILLALLRRFFVLKFININPINIIWLPFIFTYLIRPGNDFYMVFNHIVKSMFVLLLVFLMIYPLLGLWNNNKS